MPLSREELARHCSSPAFRRGVFFRDGATVHPARLVRALRREALAAGVRLHERTKVTRIEDGLLETPRGAVRAPEVVVATNAWGAGWKPLSRLLTPFGSYVVLTEPVPELLAEIGWTGGEAITDCRMFLHYFRTTADGRVLMGSGSGPIGFRGRDRHAVLGMTAATAARAEAGLRKLLPGLAAAKVEHAWGGPIDVSADHLPVFGTVPGTRMHYGAGYTGNGVGPSWLGGQILASLALGSDDEWSRLPLVDRRIRKPASGADQLPRRQRRSQGDDRRRGGGGVRPQAIGAGALRRLAAAAPRLARRDALGADQPIDGGLDVHLRRAVRGHVAGGSLGRQTGSHLHDDAAGAASSSGGVTPPLSRAP